MNVEFFLSGRRPRGVVVSDGAHFGWRGCISEITRQLDLQVDFRNSDLVYLRRRVAKVFWFGVREKSVGERVSDEKDVKSRVELITII